MSVQDEKINLFALITHLETAYPQFTFRCREKRFKFRYPDQIFLENPEIPACPPAIFALQTLHELGHALCKHKNYDTDVSRLKIEREAWEAAKKAYLDLPKTLKTFTFDEDFVEDSLDTYRDWLHNRSKCKNCGLTRYQTPDGLWHCPRCENFC